MGKQQLIRLQQLSRQFLILLAEKANFNTSVFVEWHEIVPQFGLTSQEGHQVVNYLEGKGFLKVETLGGSLRIKPPGITQVEVWLETEEGDSASPILASSQDRPSVVVDNAGANQQRKGRRVIIGPIFPTQDDDTPDGEQRAATSDIDEQVRLALLAQKYGSRIDKKIKPATIATWEKIATNKRRVVNGEVVILKNDLVYELTGLNPSTYSYHRKMMIKSGFWQDMELPLNDD